MKKGLTFIFILSMGYQQIFSQFNLKYPLESIDTGRNILTIGCTGVSVTSVLTSQGIVLFDTHRSSGIMNEIKKLITKELGSNNYKYVVSTHGHWDHIGGNELFRNTEIIAHENAAKCISISPPNAPGLSSYAKNNVSRFEDSLKSLTSDAEEAIMKQQRINAWKDIYEFLCSTSGYTLPTKTFRDSLVLKSGDHTFELYFCGNLHTNHDIITYIPEESAIITGDLLNNPYSFSFPVNKISNVPELISLFRYILIRDPDLKYIITSHGGVFPGTELCKTINILEERYAELNEKYSAAVYFMNRLETEDIKTALKSYEHEMSQRADEFYKSEDEFNTLAEILVNKAELNKAIGVLELTLKEFPNSVLAYDNLGRTYLKKGDYKNAIRYYEKSLELFPENNSTRAIIEALQSKNKKY